MRCQPRRPSYLIICDDGGEQLEVPDFVLRPLPEPRSPLMPRTSGPPSIAAPSPSAPVDGAGVPNGGRCSAPSTARRACFVPCSHAIISTMVLLVLQMFSSCLIHHCLLRSWQHRPGSCQYYSMRYKHA